MTKPEAKASPPPRPPAHPSRRGAFRFGLLLALLSGTVRAGENPEPAAALAPVANAGFETGDLSGWKNWRTRAARITSHASSGQHAIELGPERGLAAQAIKIVPDSRYRLSARVRTEVGAEEVQLIASDYGGLPMSVSSARTDYTEISLEFVSARTAQEMLITLMHPSGPGKGYADEVQLTRLGPAPPPQVQEMLVPAGRILAEEGGAAQQPDEVLAWFQAAKFGLFIHWGVYAAMDEGAEWVMHERAYPPETYRRRAEDPVNGFTAASYRPADWAALARRAGMRYVVLTARHHDGYALFDSRHENSWTSVQHLGRDFIRDYVAAVREAGLHVGLYYSPMSWRYPGYYDVTGQRAKPNVWGYGTAPENKENARVMKEEVYEQVTRLLSDYGPLEYLFWDGGWLGQSIDAEMEDRFWDTGLFQNPANEWPVAERYLVRDGTSGRALGIMGLVRHFQPRLLVNERFGWVGDIHSEEGISAPAGPIRVQPTEKCMPLMKGGWGYRPDRPVFSFEDISVHLSACVVRNINFLLNVSPDREGRIPDNQRAVLEQVGRWMDQVGESIHGTHGGPWQPQFGEYGFTYRANQIYAHVFAGYRERGSGTFTTHSLGSKSVQGVRDLLTGRTLPWSMNADRTLTVRDVDYTLHPAVTILAITLGEDVSAP